MEGLRISTLSLNLLPLAYSKFTIVNIPVTVQVMPAYASLTIFILVRIVMHLSKVRPLLLHMGVALASHGYDIQYVFAHMIIVIVIYYIP